jgi:hypothetical protein
LSLYFRKTTQVNKKFTEMQITAKLIQLLPLQTGVSKNGEWKKQDIIVETDGQYPKKICVAIWGDKIQSAQLAVGNRLTVDFDIESREFNGRWYTDVKAWKVESANAADKPASSPITNDYNFPEPPPLPADQPDDLPF